MLEVHKFEKEELPYNWGPASIYEYIYDIPDCFPIRILLSVGEAVINVWLGLPAEPIAGDPVIGEFTGSGHYLFGEVLHVHWGWPRRTIFRELPSTKSNEKLAPCYRYRERQYPVPFFFNYRENIDRILKEIIEEIEPIKGIVTDNIKRIEKGKKYKEELEKNNKIMI
jgi:hypothetical protein